MTCGSPIKRDAELYRLRLVDAESKQGNILTLADALRGVETRKRMKPGLKSRTQRYYKDTIATIIDSLPDCAVGEWKRDEAARWWRGYCKAHCAQQANNSLRLVRLAMAECVERGIIRHDPTKELNRQRLKRRKLGHLPDADGMDAIIAEISGNGSRFPTGFGGAPQSDLDIGDIVVASDVCEIHIHCCHPFHAT